MKHILSLSGGKDSTALLLHALERGVIPQVVFADTGNEHPITYQYVEYLDKLFGPFTIVKMSHELINKRIEGKREWIKNHWADDGVPQNRINDALRILEPTGNPFLDLCIWKGRFPSTRRRFCSEMLKHEPIRKHVIDPILKAGHTVISWQGVRADESRQRANLDIVEQPDESENLIVFRPLICWTADDVFDQHRRWGIKWNPLYEMGMRRVGCMPCIHANKHEMRYIAKQFPEVIDRVESWEKAVSMASKGGASMMLDQRVLKKPGPIHYSTHGIRQYVEWSFTKWGGKLYDQGVDEIDSTGCTSVYSLCE